MPAMIPENAITLVHELICAEVEIVKQENTRHGGATKKAYAREMAAASAIFTALTGGTNPTSEQISNMVSL